MRLSLVTTTILIFILILLTDPNSAQIGGTVETNTVLSIPSNMVNGDSVTVTSATTFIGGSVFLGQATIYHLNDIRTKGSTDFGTSLTLTDPVFQFGVSTDMTLRVLKIPITSISSISVLHWNITDSNDNLLADGEIGTGNLVQMEQDGSVMIVIGSIQSDDTDNDNKYPNGIHLTSGIYKISLSQNGGMIFNSSASNTYQGVYAYEYGVLQVTYPQLYLMGGSHRERLNTVGGQVSSTFTVNSGTSYILAYYGDGTSSFRPSYEFRKITVASNSPLTVNINDMTSSPGSSITVSTEVYDSGSPVLGATVEFSVLLNNILTPIGTASTNAAGYAQIFYSADLPPGNYSIYAEAKHNSQYGIGNATLTLTAPVATWNKLQANADYGSEGNGNSLITVSGTIKTQGGNPIVDADIDIWADGLFLIATKSNGNGDFSYSYVVTKAVGSYPIYYSVNITDGFWNPTSHNIDLIVGRGQLLVNTDDISVEFIDQPTNIVGNITNTAGELITSNINLDWETSPGTWTTVNSIISDSFDFTLQSHDAGSYNYRIRVDESVNWISVVKPIIVSIGQSNAALARGPWSTTFNIQFHQSYDFSAFVLKDDLSPVENANVQISVFHPISLAVIIVAGGVTDSNGIVSLYWMPDDGFLIYPGQQFIATYTATHPDYVITNLQTYFTLVSIDISISLEENSWIYDTTNSIVFNITDQFGFPAIEGKQFDATIEGTSYILTTDMNGQGIISHKFANVGSTTMSITSVDPSPIPYFPYHQYSTTLPYTISKGEYTIAGSNENVARGQNHIFSSIITVQNGNPLSNPALVNLWLFDVTWIKLGEISDISNFDFPVDIVLNEGTYTIEWRVQGNSLFNDAAMGYLLTVDKSASEIIFVDVPSSYNFNDFDTNRYISILLQVPLLSEPVANQFIIIDFISDYDSYSWFPQTNASGMISFTLPQQPATGSYVLTVNFVGDSNYLTSIEATDITVLGIDTILTYISGPVDGYYAEDQLIIIHAQDILGNNLENFNIYLNIGSTNFSVQTNSSGIAIFSINMVYEGSVEITIVLQPKNGWNGQSLFTTVNIQKKQLQITSELNSVAYSPTNSIQDLDFAILVQSNNDPYLANIKLELYWLNPSTSTFEFVGIYYTDNTGHVYLTLTFPAIDASQSYYFSWTATDPDFIVDVLDHSYIVTPMLLDVTILYTGGYYRQSTPFDFTVRDTKGRLVDDLVVYMSYTEIILLWSDQQTTTFGTAQIQLYAPSVGDLSVYYIISDSNDNYISEEGIVIITIYKSDTSVRYSIDDDQGTVILSIDVKDPSNSVINEGTVTIESWQGIWITENTISLTQTNTVVLNMYADSMQFRLRYVENSHYNGSQLIFDIYKQDINVIADPFDMELNDGLPIYLQMNGNVSLDGYLVEFYILDPDTTQWINYGSLYSSNGIINQTIPINYGMGTYQMRIVIPEQGWYREFNQTYSLEIKFNHFLFIIDNDEYIKDIMNNIEVRINTSAPDAVTNVQLDLYVEVDASRILLGTAFTDSNGIAIFSFTPTMQYGNYQFVIESTQTVQIHSTTHIFPGVIGYSVFSEFLIEDSIDYDQGGILSVRLIDHNGQPISNSQVDIFYSLFDSVSQSYSDPQELINLTTNSTGHVTITVPANIILSDNMQISLSLNDQLVIGNTIFNFNTDIIQPTPSITYYIDDAGVSQYATITIAVLNTKDQSIRGEISWTLKSGAQITVLQGSGYLLLIDDIFKFEFEVEAIYIGQYQLIIDFHDTDLLNKYLDTSIIIDFGWSKTTGTINLLTSNVIFNQSQEISFEVFDSTNLHPLANIPVMMLIDGLEYNGVSDQLGLVFFNIPSTPGIYNIEFTIYNSLLVDTKSETFNLEITKGYTALFLSEPSNYNQIPSSIEMNISDPLFGDNLLEGYEVIIYRDSELVMDADWVIDVDGKLTIYPIYAESIALSTQSNHVGHLYPGFYKIEITRYHPHYENSTYIGEFTIIPMNIEFNYAYQTINGTLYMIILYENDTEIDIEFAVLLQNTDLRSEFWYENIRQIEIPWTQGTMTILIEGKGYVSGRRTGVDEITTNSTTSISDTIGNSTKNDGGYGLDNLISVNAVQTIGGLIIVGSASAAPMRKYLKKRK